MKEEELDNLIEKAINSVASKKADMAQWDMDNRRRMLARKRWRIYGISAAASAVVIIGVGISIFLNRESGNEYGITSTTPIYRGGSCDISEIQAMIDSLHYEMALQAIDVTLADTLIDPSYTSERQDYLRSLNANREYELIWLKINALAKSGKTTEAIPLLEEYVKKDGEHLKEAQTLLNDLTK